MDAPGRIVHPLFILALVLAAVAGYLLGSHHGTARAAAEDPPSRGRLLSNSGLLLEYPVDWRQAATARSVPGLPLTRPVTVTPRGTTAAGLLTGQLPAGGDGPLPASFLARLRRLPRVEVVDLISTQAYRYSRLSIPGYGGELDLYVIPADGGGARVMACFAARQLTVAAEQCERTVSGVALTGPPSATLTPEPVYATALSAVIATLDTERARERRVMASDASAAAVASAASSLAKSLSSAAASVALLQPPGLLAPTSAALGKALSRASRVYSALASAADLKSVVAYDTARTAVGSAEGEVDAALANLTLLGYGPA